MKKIMLYALIVLSHVAFVLMLMSVVNRLFFVESML